MKMEEIIEKYVCSPSTVAVAGASPKVERAVHGVMEYLKEEGFRLFPVNPSYAGEDIQGLSCLGSITQIGERFDILALFVSPERRPVLKTSTNWDTNHSMDAARGRERRGRGRPESRGFEL